MEKKIEQSIGRLKLWRKKSQASRSSSTRNYLKDWKILNNVQLFRHLHLDIRFGGVDLRVKSRVTRLALGYYISLVPYVVKKAPHMATSFKR